MWKIILLVMLGPNEQWMIGTTVYNDRLTCEISAADSIDRLTDMHEAIEVKQVYCAKKLDPEARGIPT